MKPSLCLQALSAAVLALSYATITYADETSAQKQPIQLATIVVTAQKDFDNNGLQLTADPKQPIQPVPASDGAAYLKSFTGFNTINNGGTNGDITFRGMFGSRIKVLTDGSENLGACPNRMDSPTAYIAPENFDKITIIKGPQTVRYANSASAATVLFDRTHGYQGADNQASAVAGSFGRLDQNVSATVGNGGMFYARVDANHSQADDYKDGDNTSVHSAWQRWNTDATFGFTPSDVTVLEVKAGVGDAEAAYEGRMMDGTQFKRQTLGLYAEHQISVVKLSAQVDYNYNDHIMDNYRLRPLQSTKMATEVTRRTLNSRANVQVEFGNLHLDAGVDSQYNKHAKGNPIKQPNVLPADMKFQSYGIFSEIAYHLPSGKWVGGLRFDRNQVDNLKERIQRQETLPSGFIRYEGDFADGAVQPYIGIGYVSRMPDYWELMSAGDGQFFNTLNPEKTAQLDIGSKFQWHKFNAVISAYAGKIDDFILIKYGMKNMSMGNMPMKTALSAHNVDATIAGAEASIGYQLTEQLQANLGGMYAWGKNTTDDTPLPQVSPLEGYVNLNYATERYSLGLLWRVVAAQHRISLNEGNIAGYDVEPSKGFGLLSVNGNIKLNDSADLTVGVDNLLNRTYREHLNRLGAFGTGDVATPFNNPGRNYWVRMNVKF